MATAKVLLAAALVFRVSASIDTSLYEHESQVYTRSASHIDVLQAMYFVDFNLTNYELNAIDMWIQMLCEGHCTNGEGVGVMIGEQFDVENLKTIYSIKSNDFIDGDRTRHNALMLILNYDLMAQILDLKYVPGRFSVKMKDIVPQFWHLLDLISILWDLPQSKKSNGAKKIYLNTFYDGTEEEIITKKKQVFALYKKLDSYVLETLNALAHARPLPPHPFSNRNDEKEDNNASFAKYNKKMRETIKGISLGTLDIFGRKRIKPITSKIPWIN